MNNAHHSRLTRYHVRDVNFPMEKNCSKLSTARVRFTGGCAARDCESMPTFSVLLPFLLWNQDKTTGRTDGDYNGICQITLHTSFSKNPRSLTHSYVTNICIYTWASWPRPPREDMMVISCRRKTALIRALDRPWGCDLTSRDRDCPLPPSYQWNHRP